MHNLPATRSTDGPLAGALTPCLPPDLRRVLALGIETRIVDPEKGGGVDLIERPDWVPPPVDDMLHAQARLFQKQLEGHLAASDPQWLGLEIGKFLAHRWRGRQDDSSPEVQEALIGDWIDDLHEFPAWAIETAIRQWRRTQSWAPTIADIRARCERETADDRRSLRLIMRLLRAA